MILTSFVSKTDLLMKTTNENIDMKESFNNLKALQLILSLLKYLTDKGLVIYIKNKGTSSDE
jgi:hypothetical protein